MFYRAVIKSSQGPSVFRGPYLYYLYCLFSLFGTSEIQVLGNPQIAVQWNRASQVLTTFSTAQQLAFSSRKILFFLCMTAIPARYNPVGGATRTPQQCSIFVILIEKVPKVCFFSFFCNKPNSFLSFARPNFIIRRLCHSPMISILLQSQLTNSITLLLFSV